MTEWRLPGGVRILVVDDDPAIRRLLIRQLAMLGADTVDTAADGGEALRQLRSAPKPYSVVICDLNMPGDDGLVLLRGIAEEAQQPPIVLLSGEDRAVLRAAERLGKGHDLRIIGVISKPHTLQALSDTLARIGSPDRAVSAGRPPDRIDRADLLAHLRAGRLEVWFQPQLHVATKTIRAVEALARLRAPTGELIAPARFIPTAEQHDLIGEVTSAALEQSIRWCRTWQDAGTALSISINIAPQTLSDVAFPDHFASRCKALGGNPSDFILELTESSVSADPAVLLDAATRLRLKGFRLSIDDFGTGYSSLEQLRDLPFNELKIDRQFIKDAVTDSTSLAIVEHSVHLARQLELSIVAEGVESDRHLALVERLGIDLAQGYGISRPMPAADVLGWLVTR